MDRSSCSEFILVPFSVHSFDNVWMLSNPTCKSAYWVYFCRYSKRTPPNLNDLTVQNYEKINTYTKKETSKYFQKRCWKNLEVLEVRKMLDLSQIQFYVFNVRP